MEGDRLSVAVVLGGRSPEHEVSLDSGRNVLAALSPLRHRVRPVLVDRRGAWWCGRAWSTPAEALAALERQLARPEAPEGPGPLLSDPPDVAFLAVHGRHGEDGEIQGFLQAAGVPYTGSGVTASACAMDKAVARALLRERGIPVPEGLVVREEDDLPAAARLARERIGPRAVVKIVNGGSSLGVEIVRDLEQLPAALARVQAHGRRVLVERYIEGTEVTCAVLGNTEQGVLEALPVTEIVPRSSDFFDYRAKYTPGACEEITPARLPEATARRVQELALRAHAALGCGGASRTDFMIGFDDAYVLEVNTLPGLTRQSLLPQAACVAGLPFPQLVDRLISLGLERARFREVVT